MGIFKKEKMGKKLAMPKPQELAKAKKAHTDTADVRTLATYAFLTVPFSAAAPVSAVDSSSANTFVENLVKVMGTIFSAVGVFLIAWGIGSMILAMRNDDPEGKVKAGMNLATGVVLLMMPTILSTLKLSQYITWQ